MIITGDLHLGFSTYGKEYDEIIENKIKELILFVSNEDKVLILTGDLSHYNNPNPSFYTRIISILYFAFLNKVKVYIINGNHDIDCLQPLLNLQKALNFNIFFEVSSVIINRINFIFIPFIKKSLLDKTYNEFIEESIKNHSQKDLKNVLITHYHFEGSKIGSENIFLKSGVKIDKLEVPVDLIVSGHIHKHQSFKIGNIPIYYHGSLERIDFSERNDEKGYLTLDNINGELLINFNKLKSIEFVKLEWTYEEFIKFDLKSYNEEKRDCIIWIAFKVNKSDFRLINIKELKNKLNLVKFLKIDFEFLDKEYKEEKIEFDLMEILKREVRESKFKNKKTLFEFCLKIMEKGNE